MIVSKKLVAVLALTLVMVFSLASVALAIPATDSCYGTINAVTSTTFKCRINAFSNPQFARNGSTVNNSKIPGWSGTKKSVNYGYVYTNKVATIVW